MIAAHITRASYLFAKPTTMALRVLIVDDEADARDNLRLMLEEYCPEVEIVYIDETTFNLW